MCVQQMGKGACIRLESALGMGWDPPPYPPHTHIHTFSSWLKPDASMLLRLSAADELQAHASARSPACIYQSVTLSTWSGVAREQ